MKLGKKETFIGKAKLIHGNKYDYSLVEYFKAINKVKIICSDHGIFEQSPNNHLSNHGCGKCCDNIKSTTDEFIKKAILVHNEKYIYSLVNYNGNKEYIQIMCKEHGLFKQKPSDHLKGLFCNKKEIK